MTPREEGLNRVRRVAPVETSVAAFVGAVAGGHEGKPSTLLTSFADFQRTFGAAASGLVASSARAFFDQGGRRLYVVPASTAAGVREGLAALESLSDVAVVAAPGGGTDVASMLIEHVEKMRYRFAVLDSGQNDTPADVRALRSRFNSTRAALYYPWLLQSGSSTPLPPSGVVAGIYSRVDEQRGVHKSPANEMVSGALGMVHQTNEAEQAILNPEGINCFRTFHARGILLWGARTVSSDAEFKYVNVRRLLIYLEHSIENGTQWALFEPNGEALWSNVRATVTDFLYNSWRTGALLGSKPEQAFFVCCDRTTMTQNDLDNGRLVVEIGVAALRPAEFVIFRIGQWTADHKP